MMFLSLLFLILDFLQKTHTDLVVLAFVLGLFVVRILVPLTVSHLAAMLMMLKLLLLLVISNGCHLPVEITTMRMQLSCTATWMHHRESNLPCRLKLPSVTFLSGLLLLFGRSLGSFLLGHDRD